MTYSKTSLKRATMEPTLNGPFMEVVRLELEYAYNAPPTSPGSLDAEW